MAQQAKQLGESGRSNYYNQGHTWYFAWTETQVREDRHEINQAAQEVREQKKGGK